MGNFTSKYERDFAKKERIEKDMRLVKMLEELPRLEQLYFYKIFHRSPKQLYRWLRKKPLSDHLRVQMKDFLCYEEDRFELKYKSDIIREVETGGTNVEQEYQELLDRYGLEEF